MNTTTVKFGGSSLSDAVQFKKVRDIVKAGKSRRYVVPSAPGKRFSSDIKVTDMLYSCYDAVIGGSDAVIEFKPVAQRFNGIIDDLGLPIALDREYDKIIANFKKRAGKDYAASRGEYLCGIVLANFLEFNFVDSADVVRFNTDGSFDSGLTNTSLQAKLETLGNAVIPGFYGSMPDGTVKTFSRGGSDFTGALVSKAANSSLYENWTDVSGFLVADPRIVHEPKVIDVITYRELRELSYMGATVLHESAIFPVRDAKIPINIKNTNNPKASGTMIVPENDAAKSGNNVITGIAGKKNFSVIYLEKDEMNGEVGFLRRILTLLEAENINFEHIPTGIDTLSIVVNTDELYRKPHFLDRLAEVAKPNHMEVDDKIAVIAVVGRSMKEKPGTAARVCAALAHSKINIRMIDQGSSELNIIVGVREEDFETAIRVIYEVFDT